MTDARGTYRRRIRRHLIACACFVAVLAAVVVLGSYESPPTRGAVVGIGFAVALLGLGIATLVNLRCPACRRFLDSRFLLGSAGTCPGCSTRLR